MRTATGEYPWMLSQHLARKAGDRNPVVFILQSLQIFDNCAPNQSFGCFTWPARLASNTEHSSYGISDGRLVARSEERRVGKGGRWRRGRDGEKNNREE